MKKNVKLPSIAGGVTVNCNSCPGSHSKVGRFKLKSIFGEFAVIFHSIPSFNVLLGIITVFSSIKISEVLFSQISPNF